MSMHDSGQHATGSRPHSIDLSLELERQLDNESLPPNSPPPNKSRPQSLDPQVVSAIVTNLRTSLAEVQAERDALTVALQEVQKKAEESSEQLRDALEKKMAMETELEAAKQKTQEDAETLAMLRSKVEESRRGLMRLQTENRRMSHTPLDLSRAGIPAFGTPASGKRTSFTPLTGSPAARMQAHKRISSVSDSSIHWGTESAIADSVTTSPNSQVVTLPDVSSPAPPSRRFSGLFGRAQPTAIEPLDLGTPKAGPTNAELESLRQELKTLKTALEETRGELTEVNEAKEASESLVKVLREFIAENSIGPNGQASAAPRSSTDGGSRASISSSGGGTPSATSGLWGFKLWKSEAQGSEPSMSPTSERNVPLPKTQSQPAAQTQAEPLTKKIGGFFASRTASAPAPAAPRPSSGVQEPMYNGSDTTSSESAEDSVLVSPIGSGPGLDELAVNLDQKALGAEGPVEVAL